MSSFPVVIRGDYGDQWKTDGTTKKNELGTRMVLPDGRIFAYVRVGAAALVPGKLYQGVALIGGADTMMSNDALLAADAAAGDKSVSIVSGGTTAIGTDDYADGSMFVSSSTHAGIGYTYRIESCSSAAAASQNFTVYLTDNESIQVAIVAASATVGLRASMYDKILLTATNTATVSGLVGVTCGTAAASTYAWVQTKGTVACFTDASTPIVGEPVTCASAVAGAIGKFEIDVGAATAEVTTTSVTKGNVAIGYCLTPAASAEYSLIYLNLD